MVGAAGGAGVIVRRAISALAFAAALAGIYRWSVLPYRCNIAKRPLVARTDAISEERRDDVARAYAREALVQLKPLRRACPRDVDLLMATTGPEVGLLLDTGHLTYAGADVLATTRRHARRINHVHCKDIRLEVLKQARQRDMSFLDAILEGVFTVPGDGMIDYYAFARLLADIGYSGWAVVEAEQDPVKAPPGEYSKLGFEHLTETFRAAGYEVRE